MFSARHQGDHADAVTGEEPGKIHHELPGVKQDDRLTTYDACDTTALFLLALAYLAKRGDPDVVRATARTSSAHSATWIAI